MLVTGLISSSWYGWPMVFYLYGAAGLLWSFLFVFFGYNAPACHPSITEEEKFYIESSLGHVEDKPVSRAIVKIPFNIPLHLGYVFLENGNSLEENPHLGAGLGHPPHPVRSQLGLLDLAHRNPRLHEPRDELQYQICKYRVMKAVS